MNKEVCGFGLLGLSRCSSACAGSKARKWLFNFGTHANGACSRCLEKGHQANSGKCSVQWDLCQSLVDTACTACGFSKDGYGFGVRAQGRIPDILHHKDAEQLVDASWRSGNVRCGSGLNDLIYRTLMAIRKVKLKNGLGKQFRNEKNWRC